MDNAPRSTSLLKAHDSKGKKKKKRKKKIGVDTFTEFCFHLLFFLFNIIVIQMLKMYEQYVVA